MLHQRKSVRMWLCLAVLMCAAVPMAKAEGSADGPTIQSYYLGPNGVPMRLMVSVISTAPGQTFVRPVRFHDTMRARLLALGFKEIDHSVWQALSTDSRNPQIRSRNCAILATFTETVTSLGGMTTLAKDTWVVIGEAICAEGGTVLVRSSFDHLFGFRDGALATISPFCQERTASVAAAR